MRHVGATALVVPKHFIFTFVGNLQLFILIQNKGQYWSVRSSIFGHIDELIAWKIFLVCSQDTSDPR